MEIRIALAAETMLYLPIYCLERVYGPSGLTFTFVNGKAGSQLGDDGAYKKLTNGEVAFCVCDPMVLLDEFKTKGETIGVLVGSIATKTGLWGVIPEQSFTEYRHGDRFIEFLRNRHARINNIVTYDTASTAGRVVDYLKSKRLIENDAKVITCEFGDELTHLRTPLEGGNFPDLIITCDLCAALAAEARNGKIRIGLDLPKQIDYLGDTLFTGLIVHRGFLANNEQVVIHILKALQDVMEYFSKNKQVRENMAEMLAASERSEMMFRSLAHVGVEDDCIHFCKAAAERLYSDKIIATSVKLDSKHWNKQAEIWYPNESHSQELKKDPYNFRSCSDLSVGRKACPGPVVREARRLRKFIVPVLLPIALVVEVFDSVASWYHLKKWDGPDLRFWLIVFGIAIGTLVLMWLLDLRGDDRHK